jgi:hypothetical protein
MAKCKTVVAQRLYKSMNDVGYIVQTKFYEIAASQCLPDEIRKVKLPTRNRDEHRIDSFAISRERPLTTCLTVRHLRPDF